MNACTMVGNGWILLATSMMLLRWRWGLSIVALLDLQRLTCIWLRIPHDFYLPRCLMLTTTHGLPMYRPMLRPASTRPNDLVPNTSRPMVWYGLFSLGLQLLHCVIQEKVYQDSIDLGLWMLAFDLAPDEFHAPDATSCIVLLSAGQNGSAVYQHLPLSCIS